MESRHPEYLIKEGEWAIVAGRSIRPYVKRKTDTDTDRGPAALSYDVMAYDLEDKAVVSALQARNELEDKAESASAII